MARPESFSFCHCCGTALGNGEFPRTCSGCGHMQFHNPTPIGVLLQAVTDDNGRIGILTPIRGHAPMAGYPALTGGFQEATDQSSEEAGARELMEEVQQRKPLERDVKLLVSRACGPFTPPGKRQNLVFGVNHKPLHISAFDDFIPDAETLSIEFSWAPRVLAFPTHTYALARYFLEFHGSGGRSYLLNQPRTGDVIYEADEMTTIYDVPYAQPLLEQGLWSVLLEKDNKPVAVIQKNGRWNRA